MAKNRLFLLDAMALLYRAHFAFIKNPRITSEGLNTSAIFGFTNTLLEIMNKEDPSHLAVAFDITTKTFRHKDYAEYKANREDMPEDLRKGIPYVYRLLKVLDIPALGIENYEADDIIGTIAHHIDPEEFEVYMVTPDKDYAQLVTDNVFLYKPKYKGGGFDLMDAAQVEEKMGIPPSQVIDFLALKGDSVDNIPGIPKIGDKTAISLLQEYGSLEAIIEQAENISKKSIRESVIANKEQGLMSQKLATIHRDVPFEWSVEKLKIGHCDLEELLVLMKELEFRTTTQRILNTKLNPARPDQQRDLFGNAFGEENEFELPSETEDFESSQQSYKLLKTKDQRKDFIEKVKRRKVLCFDTETTDLNALKAELIGISFSINSGVAFFIHFPEDMGKEEIREIISEFDEVLQSPDILKVGQNLKYDLLVLKSYDIEIKGPFFDTMLAHYVIEPGGKHGMDAMSEQLLNYKPISIESLIGKKGKKQLSMRDVEMDTLVKYACEDADITLRLQQKLAPSVKENKVFEEIEQPLMPVLTDMEFEGVRLDTSFLADYSEDLKQRLKILKNEVYELAGEEFNINSPKQLGNILFDKLELGKGKKQKKTKTGQYVTNEQVLTSLALSHDLPAKVLSYRGVTKLKSTYVDALPKMINPFTERIHTSFRQSVAVTGRLSSDNPNLQNIPIRTDDGREVRKAFVPRDEDHLLLSADYSQVELRLMAAVSGDEAMIEAFQSREDIHRATAARVFGLKPEEITAQQRSYAKQVNFGIIYGISAFGLSQRIGISRTEAQEIIDNYFEQYSGVKKYMDDIVDKAKAQQYVETLFGRRRYLPDINSKNSTVRGFAERNAINSPIQGTAADIIKIAMIRIHNALKKSSLKSRMILQVHDELVFDAHKSEIDELKALVKENMMGAVDLAVPLEVEMGSGMNWLEAH